MSRVVYSTCNLCKEDPTRPPLWQIRALSAVQDTEHKRIEYTDAEMEMWGIPVAYFPYFSHADPSVKRASGYPDPLDRHLQPHRPFVSIPYYGVLDDQSDVDHHADADHAGRAEPRLSAIAAGSTTAS